MRGHSLLGLILGCLISVSPVFAGSLWPADTASPYSSIRAHKVGDIITILIEETTRANQSAGTNTSKKTGIQADFLANWDRVASALGTHRDNTRMKSQISGGDDYAGAGETSRKSLVTAKLSATVTQVLPNGNLYVLGKHNVNVNDETETIVVAGIIRPSDISAQNAVYSSQIADAQISIKGNGTVAAKQTPGLLGKMFGWLF
jgi:flagellar L-ring protein precursor FlgH